MERCLDISVWNLSLLSSALLSNMFLFSLLVAVSTCPSSYWIPYPLCLFFLCCPGYLWTSALWHPWCSWCGNHVWPQKKLFSHWGQRPSGSLHCVTWARYRSYTYRHIHVPSNATKFHPMPPSDISRHAECLDQSGRPKFRLSHSLMCL